MWNIPVPEIILNEPRICALIGQSKATRMAQHVRVRVKGQLCQPAIIADHHPGGFTAQRATSLADKERIRLRLHLRACSQPYLYDPEFVPTEWLCRGQSRL